MELSQIEAFNRVVDEGTLTRAAHALGITQPAVSARLQALEAVLGGSLFERRGRILHLTPLGENFLPYARRMLALAEEAQFAAHQLQRGAIGQIRVSAPTPFLISFLMPMFIKFRHQHPHIDILIRERNKTSVFDLIHDNVITLGLVNAPVFESNMTILARFRDPIIPVASTNHWLGRTDKVLQRSDILKASIFRVSLFPRMTVFMDELVEQARHANGGAVVSLPMVMAYELTKQGYGMTFLPQTYVKPAIDAGELCQLHIEDIPILFSEPLLIKSYQRTLDPIHESFVALFTTMWQDIWVH